MIRTRGEGTSEEHSPSPHLGILFGFLAGGIVVGAAFAMYLSINCVDISDWAAMLNAFGSHLPRHLVACAAP